MMARQNWVAILRNPVGVSVRFGSSSLHEGGVLSAAGKRMARGSPLLNPRGSYGARDCMRRL